MATSKQITVPKGSDVVRMSVTGHKFVRLVDARGAEIFRSDSPGEDVTTVIQPGPYTIETDGKIGRVEFNTLDSLHPQLRNQRKADASKPPAPRQQA